MISCFVAVAANLKGGRRVSLSMYIGSCKGNCDDTAKNGLLWPKAMDDEEDLQPTVPRTPWPISRTDVNDVAAFLLNIVKSIDAVI